MPVASLLPMGRPQRHAAARNGCSGLLALSMLGAVVVLAEEPPSLILPPEVAVAVTSPTEPPARTEEPRAALAGGATGPALPGFIPKRLLIPDLYSEEIGFRVPRHVAPVDADRVVGFDLLARPRRGWTAELAYDEESRGPLPGDADVVRFVAEFRF